MEPNGQLTWLFNPTTIGGIATIIGGGIIVNSNNNGGRGAGGWSGGGAGGSGAGGGSNDEIVSGVPVPHWPGLTDLSGCSKGATVEMAAPALSKNISVIVEP